MTLDNTIYYTPEANAEYMSCSQFKAFLHCEAAAMAELTGENRREDTTALLTGSYVDAFYEGTLDQFREQHPELFKKDGTLKAEYQTAESAIERTEADPLFTEYMSGEKQRISIARAMLKDAPIIILDEATANVDPENEDRLQKAIEALTHEKTVLMIAHRLKTVRKADQILVLNGGKIVQQGRHEELIQQPGIYADFVGGKKETEGWKL